MTAKGGSNTSKRVHDVVLAAGKSGISKSHITNLTQKEMRAPERDGALRALEKAGKIECLKAPAGARGRRARWYRPKADAPSKQPSCGTCRFWLGGKCRRYPPVPYWPKMGADEWCGEHQAAERGGHER